MRESRPPTPRKVSPPSACAIDGMEERQKRNRGTEEQRNKGQDDGVRVPPLVNFVRGKRRDSEGEREKKKGRGGGGRECAIYNFAF